MAAFVAVLSALGLLQPLQYFIIGLLTIALVVYLINKV